MKRSIGKEIIKGLEDFAGALEKNEDIPEKYTCRKIALDLHPQNYDPALVKKTRAILGVSQAVFAALLNTSVSTVQKWEIGQKRPTGTALKLLHLVQKRGLEIVA